MNAADHVLSGGLAASGPDKLAIVSASESLTYGELVGRVARFASRLRAEGLPVGGRVALLRRDTPDAVALYLAVIAAGGVPVALSTRVTPEDLRHVLTIAQPFEVVADGAFAEIAAAGIAAVTPGSRLVVRECELRAWKASDAGAFAYAARAPDDAAFWVVTSGTTGRPKAVEHRHASVRYCEDFPRHALEADAHDSVFATSRLSFSYGLGSGVLGPLRIGATTILLEDWPTPDTVAQTVERYRPTLVFSVPTLYHKLIQTGLAQAPGFRSVRYFVSAGERLAPRIETTWEQTTGRPIFDAMGCSETVHKIFTNTPAARRAGSSGRPLPGVEVRLAHADGSPVEDADHCGRLQVRAPFVCSGYYLATTASTNGPEQPPERFKDGWFDTGDEYARDADGFFYHRGRSDDMLRVAGTTVAPSEIEDALVGIPSIAEAVAIAAESAAGLAEIALYVVPTTPAEGEAALAAARDRLDEALPRFKRPRRYLAVAELPRTATGKVQRHKLRHMTGS